MIAMITAGTFLLESIQEPNNELVTRGSVAQATREVPKGAVKSELLLGSIYKKGIVETSESFRKRKQQNISSTQRERRDVTSQNTH